MVTTLPRHTARRFTWARQLAGLSCRQLSELAGAARGFVAQIERGAAKAPSFGVMARFAAVLGVSLDWLAHGTGPEPTAEQVQTAVARARAAEKRARRTPKAPTQAAA